MYIYIYIYIGIYVYIDILNTYLPICVYTYVCIHICKDRNHGGSDTSCW